MTFLICHLSTWSKFMPLVGWVQFHRSLKIWLTYTFLFETLVENTKHYYYKIRQLLQNETENSYQQLIRFIANCIRCYKGWQKFITKCVRCDRLLLQSVSCIRKCDRLLLQSASGITNCSSYHKVRRNRCEPFINEIWVKW